MIPMATIERVKASITAGSSQRAAAKQNGVSPQSVNNIVRSLGRHDGRARLVQREPPRIYREDTLAPIEAAHWCPVCRCNVYGPCLACWLRKVKG